ncbi:hypothetical protein [Gordonia sp. N1V]|uniref:hypothetical protein n=1 Tax=Gordonia sp. N1V TaxID=3034163 RepID=UPI0023E1EFB8|nr:hypothetical protein [Gordonia sp. N1V]MDF3285000.1 hypothetical protein [Gordonia sp. N1V]
MKRISRGFVTTVAAAAAVTCAATLGVPPASAASVTGWVGPAGTTGFLHTSTIVNAPDLYASSKIYSAVGATASDGRIGVRPRLFKSGALCEAIDYQYNWYPAPEWSAQTSATCGSGSYNSHGFVAVYNTSSSSYDQFVTFPSNPLNWTAPAARASARSAAVPDSARTSGTNTRGEKFGSAATEQSSELALIAAIGTNGEIGYVRSGELNLPPASSPATAPKGKPASRTIGLFKSDGTTRIGVFKVN